nr:tigger transposable element-derived protein 6-like [Rhipicephalus microplus]
MRQVASSCPRKSPNAELLPIRDVRPPHSASLTDEPSMLKSVPDVQFTAEGLRVTLKAAQELSAFLLQECEFNSLSTILKNKASIPGELQNGTSARNKTVMIAAFPYMDKAVFAWFCEQHANKVPLSGRILQQKVLDFASRHAIVAKVISGEAAAVNSVTTSSRLLSNKELLSQYKPSDIYNANETALFYEMLPSKTLNFKSQKCHGGKHSKRSKKPRCFKGNRRLPVSYTANFMSWVMRTIFSSWLQFFDADMRKANRSVCLLLDNCSAHHVDVRFGNVCLVFFPPKCTSVLLPFDQGGIPA